MYLNAKRFEFKCTVDLKCRRQYQPVSFLLDDKRCRVSTALVNRSFALHLYLNVTDGCRVLWCQYITKYTNRLFSKLANVIEGPPLDFLSPRLQIMRKLHDMVSEWSVIIWRSCLFATRELKQRRFWATHVNRKWTFCTLEPWFWTNFWTDRFYKN